MIEGADPCEHGLTAACFRARPEHAKQVLAYRFMGMLVGAEYMKRLQTFKGLPLPIALAGEMGAPLSSLPGIDAFSSVSPILVSVWSGGPPHLTQSIEGDLIVPTIRKAKIDFSTAIDSPVVAAVPGQKVCVTNLALVVGGETNITLKSGTTAISGAMDFGGTDEPRGMTHGFGDYPLQTAEGEAFVITSSEAVQVSGYITYYLE